MTDDYRYRSWGLCTTGMHTGPIALKHGRVLCTDCNGEHIESYGHLVGTVQGPAWDRDDMVAVAWDQGGSGAFAYSCSDVIESS